MHKHMLMAVLMLAAVWVVGMAGTASALEWDPYVGLFAGYNMPSDTDVAVTGAGINQTFKNVELKSSLSWGGKIGAWTMETRDVVGLDLGLELDVMNYYPSNNSGKRYSVSGTTAGVPIPPGSTGTLAQVDVESTMATINLLGRLPLLDSQEFPNGRLFPYAGGGVGVERAYYSGAGASDSVYDLAYQIKGGVEFYMTHAVSAFAEFKYTMTEHTFKDSAGNNYRYDFNVMHGVAGLALHF
jgi:opacity protein-like surface antigen